jgi:hypothetical protein
MHRSPALKFAKIIFPEIGITTRYLLLPWAASDDLGEAIGSRPQEERYLW